MCYEDGRLIEYMDGEASPADRASIAAHLAECEGCAATVARLEADRGVAFAALGKLDGGPAAATVAAAGAAPAGAGAVATPSGPRSVVGRAAWRERVRRIGVGRIAAAAAAVLVVGSLAFAPVRGVAAELLKVFRVQNVQTISVSADDLRNIGNALQKGQGHVDLKSMGEVSVEGSPTGPKTVTLAAAQAAVDFPIKLPSTVKGTPVLTLQGAQTYKFKLHVDAINSALRYYGSERTFPASVDGKVFQIKVPAIVLAHWDETAGGVSGAGMAGPTGIFVGQARSPELIVPDGVDAAQIRDVLLNLPFLPKKIRDQLASVDAWQSTLLVPNLGGSSRDVTIDGVPAVVITPESAVRTLRSKVAPGVAPKVSAKFSTVVWNQSGVVRAVGGSVDPDEAVALARSCMR